MFCEVVLRSFFVSSFGELALKVSLASLLREFVWCVSFVNSFGELVL